MTHDQTEALAIGDRIGIIAHGRLQPVGTAEALIQRPANVFVAGFLGAPAMNLLPAALAALFQSLDDDRFQVGAQVRLGVDLEPLCLFDAASEQALHPSAD